LYMPLKPGVIVQGKQTPFYTEDMKYIRNVGGWYLPKYGTT